ncbi:hypothetical protein B2G71_10370 [Novosphingobium sp. PC22D]|uniref:arsenate reductase/protein-tyrosine-phosphatase family protein n=1 Tax=Novosphingobium sp. PC22D TaxID=1962403 RepID=UPI000BFB09B6|nr:phosphotyrosine protein phosphatase [Novosphingobium sp. PC22D]PEQ12702.1 hypothetical protein B2G71_10370 [Novosphingobium sp. PC22D]
MSLIAAQFGTWRGLVRLALSYAETGLGLAPSRRPDPDAVHRLVFVCHGNICRSAYADVLAREAGMAVCSFGLSTSTGNPANDTIVRIAARRGHDLSRHRATALADYAPREGDCLVAMEVRHLRKLAADERLNGLPRVLLGNYCRVPVPHLHDPYTLSPAYAATCMDRIEHAVVGLCRAFPNAVAAGSNRSDRPAAASDRASSTRSTLCAD